MGSYPTGVDYRGEERGHAAAKTLCFQGCELGAGEISRIRAIVAKHGPRGSAAGASLRDLALLVCREWDWRRPNGELRLHACQDLLRRLCARGDFELRPSPRSASRRRERRGSGGSFFSQPATVVKVEDLVLREVVVRPLRRGELAPWQEAMARFHDLGDGRIVGETLRYVAESAGRWVALVGWGAAALKIRHREAFVGWDEETKYQCLHLVANNVRFLILPWVEVPHLASVVLSRNLHRLSADWEARYDHPILLAETFIDLSRFHGTCYRAANWIYLGQTRGMGRKGEGFAAHAQPKGLFVYPLHRRAKEILSAPFPAPEMKGRPPMSTVSIDVNKLPLEGKGGLIEVLSSITDPRSRRGVRHPVASVLALSVMAALGGMRSYEAMAEWAQGLPKDLFKRLRCWCHQAPSEPTFRRVLQSVNASEIDAKVGAWLAGLTDLKAIALDGKTLRGSSDGDHPACHLLAAMTHESGVVVAQEEVAEKSNEIPGAKPLLAPLDLQGSTVTADAMHTQTDLARFLVEEKGADYVLVAKGNQPTLREDIAALDWGSFPPQAQTSDKGHGRIEVRRIYLRDDLAGYLDFPYARVVFRLERETSKLDGSSLRSEVVYGLTSRRGTGKREGGQILVLVRGRWTVENRLHWVRDVIYDEDRSQIRKRNGPRVMATLRNTAISLLRLAGARSVAKAFRWCAGHAGDCQRLVGLA